MKTRITNLFPHPMNTSHPSDALKQKLTAHIQATGLYPPIIVRNLHNSHQFPSSNGHLQILDGHLRVQILRDLGYTHVDVKNFGSLSDEQAETLLLTLNHLKSPTDPQKRADLIKNHQSLTHRTLDQLAKLLPDSKLMLQRLLELHKPKLAPPPTNLPKPFAVYLSQTQHDLVKNALKILKNQTPSKSLAQALELLAKKYLQSDHQ